MELFLKEEDYWKCRRHPSQPRTGVCPTCLRNRLILLCPDCANVRPCGCSSTTSSSFSTSSSSSSIQGNGIGAVGRVSFLIDSEPAFRRSRSTAFQFLLPRSEEAHPSPPPPPPPPPPSESRRKSSFWSFFRSDKAKTKNKNEKMDDARKASNLPRSRSVGAPCYSVPGGDVRLKSRSWYFPSPIKVFKQPKAATTVVHQRSPLCRG